MYLFPSKVSQATWQQALASCSNKAWNPDFLLFYEIKMLIKCITIINIKSILKYGVLLLKIQFQGNSKINSLIMPSKKKQKKTGKRKVQLRGK